MNPDDATSPTPHDFEELRDDILDQSSEPPAAPRPSTIKMRALFFAFIQEVFPELVERFDQESPQLNQEADEASDQHAAVLRQEAIIESEQFTSNAIIRVLEDYHAIVVDGQRISLGHKQRIIFRVLIERHRQGDYSFLTAAQLTTVIATDYRDKLWKGLDKDDVVQIYSRLRTDISSKATSAIIEHNGRRGPDSGYRLSIPTDNILLPEISDIESR